ncbi:MAG: PH domain-containing protein [Bacteroidetes bacterium]|nr:PH domain-containing protein [Rhodothermia bacterium]MCX7907506.1 PH domain-containing protein [Bacteroidota bacterium]MDW8284563.1 PH domain-containing protein [Bacteroidota bacterium]
MRFRPDPLGQLWLWTAVGACVILAVLAPPLFGFFSLLGLLLGLGGWVACWGALYELEKDRLRVRPSWLWAASVEVRRGELAHLRLERTSGQRRLGLADLVLELRDGRSLRLRDLRDPERWAERLRQVLLPEPESAAPLESEQALYPYRGTDVGDRLQTLVGLWAQGLLSEEEFQRQKAELESRPKREGS